MLKKPAFLLFFPFFIGTVSCALGSEYTPPDYKEITYYLRKLEETELEDKRLEFNKLIHDGIVHADLSNKRVIKNMKPLIEKVREAITGGLDRVNLGGQKGWLTSAVDYFEQEKRRPVLDISTSTWMGHQSQSLSGLRISSYPGKILLHDKSETKTLIESEGIHEAVLAPHDQVVAFFKEGEENSERASVWVIERKKDKVKKVGELPSCLTLLFSIDGKKLYAQEKPRPEGAESMIYRLSLDGRSVKPFCSGVLLETVVAQGRHKGALIIYKKSAHPLGLPDRVCAYAVDPSSGRELGRLLNVACR